MSRSLALKDFVFWASLVIIFPLFLACASETAHQRGPGKASSGELIDKNTTWRGGAIGAGLSKPLEGRLSKIAARASGEAAREGRPTAYLSIDGFQRVEAYPLEKGSKPNCRQIREQIYQNGKLVQDETKEVCQ
ncbi:MAG: hypothetical protein V2B13_12640 [Pseudomonadota bacterium]